MFCRKIDTDWRFRRVGDEDWMGACVPGSVYTDLLKNGKMEDPFWKDNENKALVLMEDDYEYETSFSGVNLNAFENRLLQTRDRRSLSPFVTIPC